MMINKAETEQIEDSGLGWREDGAIIKWRKKRCKERNKWIKLNLKFQLAWTEKKLFNSSPLTISESVNFILAIPSIPV